MRNDFFQEILVFVQIVKAGNFTTAGRALGLTPSTVSKVVTRLEKKFGVRLFNRTTHALRLSDEGKALLKRAKRVVEAMEEADSLIEMFSSAPAGQLRVYAMPSFALSQLAPVIPEFLAKNPEISIDVELGTENIDSIASDIDVILRYGRHENSTLISRKIADSNWVICASPTYLERYGTPRSPRDLAVHNCMSFSLRTAKLSWTFDNQGDRLEVGGNAASNLAPMLRELALHGAGIIRVADFVVARDIQSGALVQVLSEFTGNQKEAIFALYQPQPEGAQRIRAFVEFIHMKFSRRPWLVST